MADRKRPTKKKVVTKKMKKTAKPDEKKEKDRIKLKIFPCVASISEHSLKKQKSSQSTSKVTLKKSSGDVSVNAVVKKKSKHSSDHSLDEIVSKKSFNKLEEDSSVIIEKKRSKPFSYRQREEYAERKYSDEHFYIDKLKKEEALKLEPQKQEDSRYRYRTTKEMYKNIKNKRSSRVSISGIHKSAREVAGEQSKERMGRPNKFDYVARADHARTNLKLAIAWMEICGVAFLSLIWAYGFSEDAASTLYFQNKGELNGKLSHFALASFWVFLLGNAMILFRLFNQSKVRSVKYFHLFLHSIGFIFVCLSLHAYSIWWKHKKISPEHNYSLHAKIGIVTMVLYFIQFAFALCIYSLVIFRQNCRAKFYHYHSFLGFVVFFTAITTVCTGIIMEEKFKRMGISNNQYSDKWLPKVAGVTAVLFSGSVLFIIIYPYFDFEKEGEIL